MDITSPTSWSASVTALPWAVDETRLHPIPGFHKSRTIAGSERPDVQAFDTICALVERRFRLSPAPALPQRTSIFGAAETIA